MKTLRLVLGDQLNERHSWWGMDPREMEVVMVEAHAEASYVIHHIQKVLGFFAAMRHFAQWLRERGFVVHYIQLDSPHNKRSVAANVEHLLASGHYQAWAFQQPDEWRLDQELQTLRNKIDLPCEVIDTEHFMTTRTELAGFFKGKKTYLMESFYRMLRKKHGVLMDGEAPAIGQWNFDKENRKSLPKGAKLPKPLTFSHDVSQLYEMLKAQGVKTMGEVDPVNFIWPVSRTESMALFEWFLDHGLPCFGDFQDAMQEDEWSLYHSRISFSLNIKLVSPAEIVHRVEQAWRVNPGRYPIAAVEGFIRQILGWREYMRGVYWAQMPHYEKLNFFDHQEKLPSWFWTGETRMNCLSQTIRQSLRYAYAHHIQRLMITGNFANILGVHPDEVDRWYLGIYIDAIQWVEITNTRGMSQFADGGLVGTKPYVSTANYIDKMSNYCASCAYDKSKKTGAGACPFNSLFWDFYHRHREKLELNPRIGFVYKTLDKMPPDNLEKIINQAQQYRNAADDL